MNHQSKPLIDELSISHSIFNYQLYLQQLLGNYLTSNRPINFNIDNYDFNI